MSLLDAELPALTKKVGKTASILSSSVVKFYLASPNPKANKKDKNCVLYNFPDLSESQWKYTNVMGALVLIVDRALDTFQFRIYDLEAPHELRFEYELYEDIDYKEMDKQFHCFEMDDCVGGFSFASKEEAPKFLSKVNALKPTAKKNAVDALKGNKKKGGGGFFGSSKKKDNKKNKEMQVSGVITVTHTQHIGMNQDGSFDLNNISPEWKALFRQAGIKKKDLADPQMAKVIVETIQAGYGSAENQNDNINNNNTDDVDIDKIKQDGNLTAEQLRELAEYEAAMKKYEEELQAWEAEQAALSAWENDNAKYLAEKEEKERKEREAMEQRNKEAKEKEEAERAARELEELAKQQKQLEEELAKKEKKLQEAEANQEKVLKEAGGKKPPAPPPRKVKVPEMQEAAAVAPPAPPARRKTSIIERIVGPSAEQLAKDEEEKRKAEQARREQEDQNRKKLAEDREKALLEEEEKWKAERERIRKDMEEQLKREEEEIKRRVEEERQRIRDEAAKEQARLQDEINKAKNDAERRQREEEARIAAEEAEKARKVKEEAEKKAAEERERARLAAEEAQREQEAIMLQLEVMRLKTEEARRAFEEEEKRQEQIRIEAAKKKAPPIPARLPEKPPLPPPPASAPRPPPPPTALPPLPPPPGKMGGAPAAGGLSNVLKGLGTVELKKTEVSDKSGPKITNQAVRDANAPKSALLGALEKGVTLKKAGGGASNEPTKALPTLQPDSALQNNIMAKLVETMNMRRGALEGDDDEEDDWSD